MIVAEEIIKALRSPNSGPPIGSEQNPYILTLPGHLVDRIEKTEGKTIQEYADDFFIPSVKVTVVR